MRRQAFPTIFWRAEPRLSFPAAWRARVALVALTCLVLYNFSFQNISLPPAGHGQPNTSFHVSEGNNNDVVLDEIYLETPPTISVILTVEKDVAKVALQAIFDLTASAYELVIIVCSCGNNSANTIVDALASYRVLFQKSRDPSRSAAATAQLADEPRLTRARVIKTSRPLSGALADNLGLRFARSPFAILVQDDIVVDDYGWDRLLLLPHRVYPDLLAVSGRCAYDVRVDFAATEPKLRFEGFVGPCSRHSYEVSPQDRKAIYVRAVASRGPLLVDMEKIRALGYFDEEFWPTGLDEVDLCLRAFAAYGWKCSHYPISFYSESSWAPANSNATIEDTSPSFYWKLQQTLFTRHAEFFDSNAKHGETRSVTVPHDYRLVHTVVTASGREDKRALLRLLEAVRRHAFYTRFVVFDMGLDKNTVETLRTFQVNVRAFDPVDFPEQLDATPSNLKPVFITDILKETGGLVLWVAPGSTLPWPLYNVWRDIARQGAYTLRTEGGIEVDVATVPRPVVSILGIDPAASAWPAGAGRQQRWYVLEGESPPPPLPPCDTSVAGFSRLHLRSYVGLALPWRRCAFDADCYVPGRSNMQEKAVFSVLARSLSFKCGGSEARFPAG